MHIEQPYNYVYDFFQISDFHYSNGKVVNIINEKSALLKLVHF